MLEPNGPEQPKLFKPEETHSETGGEKVSDSKPALDGSAMPQRPFENESPSDVFRDRDRLRGEKIREKLRGTASTGQNIRAPQKRDR